MAVTIVRTPWIDDDGTGTTGTVINNAVKTSLYNDIDGALAKLAQLAGGNTFTGAQTINAGVAINGILTVGSASSTFTAPSTTIINITQSVAGGTNYGALFVNNDAGIQGILQCFSTTWGAQGAYFPSGVAVRGTGSGGLSITAEHASGALRFYTGGLAERLRISATGEVSCGPGAITSTAVQFAMIADAGKIAANTLQSLAATMVMHRFINNAGGVAGDITLAGAASVIYGTGSDQRLKSDLGRATDLAALRAVVVHDFTWKADGARARGVFAQEVADLFPNAITKGDDELTDDGAIARPWMTDYSKFVPDLIVGWQQHDAALAEIRALLATVTR